MEEKEQLLLKLPDMKNMPCLKCKYGQTGCTDTYCARFKVKPNSVYFENQPCPAFIPLIDTNKEEE